MVHKHFFSKLKEVCLNPICQYRCIFGHLVIFVCIALTVFNAVAAVDEAPDALVKRISREVLDIAKNDKNIQAGNRKQILELVEVKILPHVDIKRTTVMALGRYWRQATPEQQQQLVNEFRSLLMFTYSGALSRVRDQEVVFKPLRADPDDLEVEVRSQVLQSRGEPIQLNYRLEKTALGWKIYDLNVLGVWLVETYKLTFSNEISKSGVDGLIRTLVEKNRRLASAGVAE